MKVDYRILDPRISNPSFASRGSAAIDLRACTDEEFVLSPNEQKLVSTGLSIWIADPRYVGLVFARSGLGTKGLVLGNGTGIIDSDYQGELTLCLLNRSHEMITVYPLDRVAQLVIASIVQPRYNEVFVFEDSTERGTGGYGSTGTK